MKSLRVLAVAAGLCAFAFSSAFSTPVGAVSLTVDFGKEVAPLRPELHSSGFGPLFCTWGTNNIATADVKSMGFKAARTHDWALVNRAERVCDYYHIFPLMHLDAKDPKNYHFGPTDHLLRRTREETNLEVFFRLGTSIEHSGETHFNALIPEDLDKTIEIFAGTIRHYNRGWADGFKWNIRYWEIWNEPDGGNMWCYNGADAKNDEKRNAAFTKLYVGSLKRLKTEFSEIKVGGPALWFMDEEYFRMLFDACVKAGVKPDFISWHSYDRRPQKVMDEIGRARKLCDEYGFTDCELIINEWHFLGDYDWKGLKSTAPEMIRATWEGPHSQVGIDSSCYNLSLLSRFQTSPLAQGYFYGCSHTGRWGYRDERYNKYKIYYGLKLFGDFLKEYKTICASSSDDPAVTVLAAKDGAKRGALVTDFRSGKRRIELDVGTSAAGCRVWVHDDTHDFAEILAEVKDGRLVLEKTDALSAAFLVRLPEPPPAADACPPSAYTGATSYVRDAIAPYVERGELPGAISVLYDNGVEESCCLGYADVGAKRRITRDDVFMQASQTKGFCGVAVAKLVEEGRLGLDDPVSKYLPEFQTLWIDLGETNGTRTLVKAKNALTLRMCLNHTGGFPFEISAKHGLLPGGGWTGGAPLRQTAAIAAASPLLFEPGTKMQYSNTGIDIAGAVVQTVTGMKFEDYLKKAVFEPLEMTSTGFWPTDRQLETQVELYCCASNAPATYFRENGWQQRPYNDGHVFPSPGAGLWTTANDQLKFYKMLMNLGVGDNGVRILREETVKDLLAVSTRPKGLGGYSLGLVAPEKDGENEWFGHGGAFGTQCDVNWHRRQLKLWVVQLCLGPRPWDRKRNEAAERFFRRKIDTSGTDAYTGRVK